MEEKLKEEPMNHFHMIAGEIVFREKGEEQVNAIRVNGVLIDPGRDIPARLLGKAQQILQLNFHQRMGSDSIEVLDVVLMNFMYLGYMTQEQFSKMPEGVKLQEKPKEAPRPQAVPDLETAVGQATGSDPKE